LGVGCWVLDDLVKGIPPTAVGGWVQVQPTQETRFEMVNTTDGSRWIVQVQPTRNTLKLVAPHAESKRSYQIVSPPR